MSKNNFKLIEVVNPGINGTETYWYTTKNDIMVSNSLSYDKEKATEFFDKLVSNSVPEKTETVVKSVEIEY
jgi:hypothetical protein